MQNLKILMFTLLQIILLSARSAETLCQTDADCINGKGPAYCEARKIGCPNNPSQSTCVSRICIAGSRSTRPADFVKACNSNSDCKVIQLKCLCMYCARPEDVKNGIADAINKKYADLENSYKCNAEEMKNCATAGPCAQTGSSVATCEKNICTIKYEPHR